MLAPIMKRKGKIVGTSYEEEGEECRHQLCIKMKGKNGGTSYV